MGCYANHDAEKLLRIATVFYRRVFWVLSQVTIASSSGKVNSCRSSEVLCACCPFNTSRLAPTATFFFNAYTRKWPPGYFFGSFLLLFVLLTLRMVTARFHPSNWLVRMNETGIYVQYRSYLNYQLPADDPSVVFLSLGEIASARLVKERVETPDPAKPGATQTQYLRYVEIEFSGDPALLADALQAEPGEPAPVRKRWY